MSSPNAAGHSAKDPNSAAPIPGTASLAFTVTTYTAVFEGAANTFLPVDGTENAANRYAGLVGPGTYAAGAALVVFPPNSAVPQPTTPFATGELYASKTGSLVATLAAAVDLAPASTSWSLKVAKSLQASIEVLDGLIEQRVV